MFESSFLRRTVHLSQTGVHGGFQPLVVGVARSVQVATAPDTGYQIQGVADFTGDGKADILWHHATAGEVWVWRMDGATRLSETWVATVADVGYRPVIAK